MIDIDDATTDIGHVNPNSNMYGCLPCPKCGSAYRVPYWRKGPLTTPDRSGSRADGSQLTVECDECGYKQRGICPPGDYK